MTAKTAITITVAASCLFRLLAGCSQPQEPKITAYDLLSPEKRAIYDAMQEANAKKPPGKNYDPAKAEKLKPKFRRIKKEFEEGSPTYYEHRKPGTYDLEMCVQVWPDSLEYAKSATLNIFLKNRTLCIYPKVLKLASCGMLCQFPGNSQSVVNSDGCTDAAFFIIPADQWPTFRAILKTGEARIFIQGDNGTHERAITKNEISAISETVAFYEAMGGAY